MNRAWLTHIEIKRFTPYRGELAVTYQISGKIHTSVEVRKEREATVTAKLFFTYLVKENDPVALVEIEGQIHIDNFPGTKTLQVGAGLDKQPREFTELVEHLVLDDLFLPAVPAVRAAKLPTPLPTINLVPEESEAGPIAKP